MFFDNFQKICIDNGVSPSKVVTDIGMNKSAVTYWKTKGSTPNGDVLQKIADYFGISVENLLAGKSKKSTEVYSEDEELNELLEELKNNPGKRLLFSKTKKATKEDIEKIIAMVDIITGGDNGGYFY